MKKIYEAKIVDIKSGTLDMGIKNKIIDAYVKVEVGGLKFWCFVYEGWRTGRWSLSMKDKTVLLEFIFLNIPIAETKMSYKMEKKIAPIPNQKKPCDYIITGEIVDKEPHPKVYNREKIQVDFGIVVRLSGSVEKNQLKIGDYIQARGRLDAHLIDKEEVK